MDKNVPAATVKQVHQWLDEARQTSPFQNQVLLIDVRERSEVACHGKIEGALNIPLRVAPELFSAALSDLNKDVKTVFQCMSGRRSLEAAKRAMDLGFQNVFNLEGGFNQWKDHNLPVQPFMNNHSPWVHTIFEPDTETAQYVVTDLETREAYIIDPVLDYDPFGGTVQGMMAEKILKFVQQHQLNVTKIIDTHVHADHLTAAHYLKQKLEMKPEFWMGNKVTAVQDVFTKKYNFKYQELKPAGELFDRLVQEGDTWTLGNNIQCSVLSTPGHTPACSSYRIGDAAFVGDTLFMPDIGTARCDFPGGSTEQMYNSVQKMYKSWPDDTRIYVGHDYPPANSNRQYDVMTTLGAHKRFNKMISESATPESYHKLRSERDAALKAPRLIHPSLQTNLRGGCLPNEETDKSGQDAGRFFKIPVRWKN